MTEGLGSNSWEILFSNDGSKDGCAAVIAEYSEKDPRVRLVGYDDNKGKGCAIRTAVLAAEGDYILYTDCDLAYGTGIIRTISEKLASDGSDIVIGSRNISKDGYAGYTFLRKLASKTYIKVICLAAGFSHSDSQCGIKCFKGDAARRIFATCSINSFAFDLEALMTAEAMGYTVTEQAVSIINHRESTSKVHLFKDTMKMLRDIRQIKKRLKKQKF